MKITYIHQHFKRPDEAGGTRSWEFARRLAADGHSVTMICGGTESRSYHESGFDVVQLSVTYENAMSVSRRILAFVKFMLSSTKAAMRSDGDVYFCSSTPLTVAVPGMVASTLKRRRFVLEVRDLWPEAPVELRILRSRTVIVGARLLELLSYRRASCVVALSPGMKEGVLSVAPDTRVVVVPNASDLELFQRSEAERQILRATFGWAAGEKVVVYAGSLGRIYDVPWLVDLADALVTFNIKVIIIGDGANYALGNQLLDQHGINGSTVFLGSKSKQRVADYVAAADAVVSSVIDAPCLEKASINKVFDGLAAGRPVFFNHGGWLADLVCSQGAGWSLRTVENEDLGRVVEEILADSRVLSEASSVALRLASEMFDRDLLYRDFEAAVTGR